MTILRDLLELMQEVEAERDFIGHPFASLVPLEDVLPAAADARKRVPQIAVVHEVHRQDRVALRGEEASTSDKACRASGNGISAHNLLEVGLFLCSRYCTWT